MTYDEFDTHIKLVQAAAAMAAPVIANLPDDLKMGADPNALTPEMEAQDILEFRIVRTFYNFLVGTLGNETYWTKLPVLTDGGSGDAGGGSAVLDPTAVATALRASLGTAAGKALMADVKTLAMGGTLSAVGATGGMPSP